LSEFSGYVALKQVECSLCSSKQRTSKDEILPIHDQERGMGVASKSRDHCAQQSIFQTALHCQRQLRHQVCKLRVCVCEKKTEIFSDSKWPWSDAQWHLLPRPIFRWL